MYDIIKYYNMWAAFSDIYFVIFIICSFPILASIGIIIYNDNVINDIPLLLTLILMSIIYIVLFFIARKNSTYIKYVVMCGLILLGLVGYSANKYKDNPITTNATK